MNAETVSTIKPHTILITDNPGCPLHNRMASAIQCVSVNEKGFKFKRVNLNCHGEEFFMNSQGLQGSLWILPPNNAQMRFI